MAKAKPKTDLVIVESPAKARTIEKYLGSGYKVTASMGHLRDLPKSKMGVDLENDFEPSYQPIKGREDVIADLQKQVAKSNIVYLATDPDREGEAISWHLKELLELPDERARRVTFNEITKKVVTESIENPRDINQNLVDAQQARRILDRIVGYKLSPLLWRKVRRGLSAGRVQSVATRMVVDREEEIRAFVAKEYWYLDVVLNRVDKAGKFTARYHGSNGKKRELSTQDEVLDIIANVLAGAPMTESELTERKHRITIDGKGKGAAFTIANVKKGERKQQPHPPYITSTLQQEASHRLSMTPRRTMAVAQQLYEGVDISGEGTVGLITYMRTDSLRLSEEALSAAQDFIVNRYGPEYHTGKPRYYKSGRNSQDAHEAIRPSNVYLTPELVKKDLSGEQFRLYRLIWERFVACQMSNAIYDTARIDAVCGEHMFRASHSSIRFPGHTAVYEERREDSQEQEGKTTPLPDLIEGEQTFPSQIDREQKFTQPPARYTEATLVRAMEEKGIGRPSTYAPTISTITSRGYVDKEGRTLGPTILGEVVTGLMKERFPDIVDLAFTARMEGELDVVEDGGRAWKGVLAEFYDGFGKELEDAERALDGERIKIPAEESDEICDKCGKQMVIKSGRFGKFLACPGFPDCDFTKPIVVVMPGKCPKCEKRLLKRTSKRGFTFYACDTGAECGFMTWDVPVEENCPECGNTMFKKSGRGKQKTFCINEQCPNFLPEDQRGYRRKPASTPAAADAEADANTDAEEAESAVAAKGAGDAVKTAKTTKSANKSTTKSTSKSTTKSTKTAKNTKAAKNTKTTKSAKTASGASNME